MSFFFHIFKKSSKLGCILCLKVMVICYYTGDYVWSVLSNLPKTQEQLNSNPCANTTEYFNILARTDYMFCAGFFCTRKNFLTFFGFSLANHTLLYRYGAERGINTFQTILKAVAGVVAVVFTVFGISKFLKNRKEEN